MEQSLSYSSQLKQQIIISDIKSKCCASAELSAFLLMNGESNFRLKDKNLIRRINGLASKTRSLGIEKRVYFYRNKKNSTFYGVEVYHGNSVVYNEEQTAVLDEKIEENKITKERKGDKYIITIPFLS